EWAIRPEPCPSWLCMVLLFGGGKEKGPQLFQVDPPGIFVQCDALVIGFASEGTLRSLQEAMIMGQLGEESKATLITLRQVMEKLDTSDTEFAAVEPGLKFHIFTKESLGDVVKDIWRDSNPQTLRYLSLTFKFLN
uniref:Uncharacterized protein n=1 Tax=Vombatus ursinus TaxID=29139 RepID=A0A4X2M793_VOMUR